MEKEMDFGKKYRAGNFEYFKIVRSLSRKELKSLRDAAGIPADVQKHLNRGGLPYMIVQTVGGGWSVSFVCACSMYRFIEFEAMNGDDGTNALVNLFTMMYSDTTILGDDQYHKDKAAALKAFMERIEARKVSKEDDDKELDSLKADEAAKAVIEDMGINLKDLGDE